MKIRRPSLRGPPLALQIVVLMLGGLVVAQFVTLLLTVLLPPAPKAQYGLDDIAAALTDAAGQEHGGGLQRIVQAGPPDIAGPGWLVSEKSRQELARMVHLPVPRVTLAFYTPLPFAGTAAARMTAMVDDGPMPTLTGFHAQPRPAQLLLAQFTPPTGGAPGMTQGLAPPALPRDSLPPGTFDGTRRGGADGLPLFLRRERAGGRTFDGGAARATVPLIAVDPAAAGRGTGIIPGDGGVAVPGLLRGGNATTTTIPTNPVTGATGTGITGTGVTGFPRVPAGDRIGAPPGFAPSLGMPRAIMPDQTAILPQAPLPLPRVVPPLLLPDSVPVRRPDTVIAPPAPVTAPTIAPLTIAPAVPSVTSIPLPAPEESTITTPTGPAIAIAPTQRGLFGLAPAPFVEGDFIAAVRLDDGRWAVVQPAPEPFPNSWQRRVLLWFAIALALVAPFGWLFARRLVKPLDRFAAAAELLGRDPSAAIGPLDGPAEIGRAAHAFNLMQNRLRSFVDDRTAMIGAISHDLRTPLTRMRFRIEDVPDDVRDGLLEEVDEMEAMIAEVIGFIRDASIPGVRERLDLRTLVDDVVEDAQMVGNDVTVERGEPALVEIDVLGMRRVLDNLLENAVKYGVRARVRVTTDAESAVTSIFDDGPGLPDDEIERVFEPFYRSEEARKSDKSGSGLGLAVCRSIARAHGGDVSLRRSHEGFLAEVRVPLAFGAEQPLAA